MNPYKQKFETVYDDSFIGAGVTVERSSPTVMVVDPKDDEHSPRTKGYSRVRIQQSLTFSVEVLVPVDGDMARCGICKKAAPLPDAFGAQFILQNCDGGRICFPHEESCEEERDCYPVTGWERIARGEEGEILACRECCERISSALKVAIDGLRSAGDPAGPVEKP